MTGPATRFVLVHGAWHGGLDWERVAAALTARRYAVFTPTLTGLAGRADERTPGISLSDHVDDIVRLLDDEDLSDVVLCGHSYGGMVVTGVPQERRERIRALVYLDAFVPAADQSLIDLGGPLMGARLNGLLVEPARDYLRPPSAESFNVNPRDRQWVDDQLTLQPYRTFRDHLPAVDALEQVTRATYVRAARQNAPWFAALAETFRGRPSWRVVDLPDGHDLMVDTPDEVVRILVDAATSSMPEW